MSRSRLLVLLALVASAWLVAAWFDLLPGGWRLRRALGRDEARASYERHRAERLAHFAGETSPPGAVVFLGSSTMERFDLARWFPLATTLNRGLGNEPIADLDARLLASVPAEARALVLYAGSVDFRRTGSESSSAIADRVDSLLERLVEQRPACELLLLGILPERGMPQDRVAALTRLNAHLADHARARGASFVDTGRPPLATDTGSLSESFSCDPMHLADEGYAVLADWIAEALPALRPQAASTSPR